MLPAGAICYTHRFVYADKTMDYHVARANMIAQQIRPWNVLAAQTLAALAALSREDFVPPSHRHLAFADVRLPLAGGEVMLEPKLAARMMEALELTADHRVLEIGTGSGYLTALMASVCAHVTSVELQPELSAQAGRNLAMAGIDNVTLEVGDAHAGWGPAGQYDAVLISGSLPVIGADFIASLNDAGRLVGIDGNAPAMHVVRYRRSAGDSRRESLFETVVPRLRHVEEPTIFDF